LLLKIGMDILRRRRSWENRQNRISDEKDNRRSYNSAVIVDI
jgi:hypothetical protein